MFLVGTVGKMSDCHPRGTGFSCQGVNFGPPSFATPSEERDVKPLVWFPEMISRRLTRIETLLEKIRVMSPVFEDVVRGHVYLAVARGATRYFQFDLVTSAASLLRSGDQLDSFSFNTKDFQL